MVNSCDTLDVIQTLGVIVAIGISYFQMKINKKVVKSQVLNNLFQRLDSINKILFSDRTVIETLSLNYDPKCDKNKPINSFIDIVKTFFYEMYYHHKNELVSNEEWKSWEEVMTNFFSQKYVEGYWRENTVTYGFKFREYIDSLIANKKEEDKNIS